jgi:phosphoserine phosphatase
LQNRDTSLEGAYFYSDSHNDLPLLEQVDKPIAVDPDATLLARAKEAGWPVISLRA